MSELIELRFKYSEDEFAEAWQFYATRSYLKKTDVLVGIALMVASLIMTSINDYQLVWAGLFVIGFSLLILNFTSYFLMPRHHFRSDPKFQEEYYVAFSEDDIQFKTSFAESRLEWAFYDKLWNMPRYYLLFYGRDMFSIIPKRAFTEKNQEEQFKELVQRKLSPAFIQIFS